MDKKKTTTISVNKVVYKLNKDCSGVLMDRDSSPFICPWSPPKPKLDKGSIAAIALAIILLFFIIGVIIVGVIVKWRYDNIHKLYESIQFTSLMTVALAL